MPKILARVVPFLRREDGPTTVEYAVMLALIIVVCVTTVTQLGAKTKIPFQNVSSSLSGS